MLKTYKILSLLLSYPNEEIYGFLKSADGFFREEALLDEESIRGIKKFTEFFSADSLVKWQEHYVQLFDYSRGASLYLFEHLHGDSKDRGQAMVDLVDLYAMAGLHISKSELPDYLPLFLEFLSLQTSEKAAAYLAEVVDIIGYIHNKLKVKDNPFAHIIQAIIKLSSREPDNSILTKLNSLLPEHPEVESFQEKPVIFGC